MTIRSVEPDMSGERVAREELAWAPVAKKRLDCGCGKLLYFGLATD